jgi:hypothetical protein
MAVDVAPIPDEVFGYNTQNPQGVKERPDPAHSPQTSEG